MNEEKFSIIIPTRNRPKTIIEALLYLRNTIQIQCPIIIVDQSDPENISGDEISNLALSNVRYLAQEKRGTGYARNLGALTAKTDWLIFFDDDVRPVFNYFENMIQTITTEKWIDGFIGRIAYEKEWVDYCKDPEDWVERNKSKNVTRKSRSITNDVVQWFTSTPTGSNPSLTIGLSSGNLAIKRKYFLNVGGFDQNIEGLGDDKELGVRLWWYGYRILYSPNQLVFHLMESKGGTRSQSKEMKSLFKPVPSVGWVYTYLEWFPYELPHMFWSTYLRKWIRQPWSLPLRLIRFGISFRMAKERLHRGVDLLSDPRSRNVE